MEDRERPNVGELNDEVRIGNRHRIEARRCAFSFPQSQWRQSIRPVRKRCAAARRVLSRAGAPRNLVKRTMLKTLAGCLGANTPVEIASATVSEGVPPTFSATTMAMRVVTTSAQAAQAFYARRRRA